MLIAIAYFILSTANFLNSSFEYLTFVSIGSKYDLNFILTKIFNTMNTYNSIRINLVNNSRAGPHFVMRVNVSVKILAFRSGFTRNKYQCDPDTYINYLFLKFV